jgi:tetratricopeptide (TPR) repeat protein
MATKKKAAESDARQKADAAGSAVPPAVRQAYERAVVEFSAALERMNAGDFEQARDNFQKIAVTHTDESVLVERAVTYARHCERKLTPPAPAPETADELFHQAVFHSNNGEADAALGLLDQALRLEPESARLLYARASAAAIKGDAESAVTDLRRAIVVDPQVRFQAGNDPDFELIREEPAFIDIIEPTPTGV